METLNKMYLRYMLELANQEYEGNLNELLSLAG